MTSSLKQKTISAFLWSFFGQYVTQGVTFGVTLVLTRLLEPTDFGLLGMLSIFIAISNTLQNFGFNAALIQRSDVTSRDYSTVFYFNMGMSLLLYLILFLAAPWIAAFFDEPRLTLIARVYMLSLLINGFSLVQSTIFTRQINFKPPVIIRLISAIFSGSIGILMALNGFGVWSLVVQVLTSNFLYSLLVWFSSKWRPEAVFDRTSFKNLMGFSSKIFLSHFINRLFHTLDNFVIGKIFSTAQLGFYTRARSLKEFPIKNTTTVLERVLFPVFATIQDDNERLMNLAMKFTGIISFIVFPMMFGLAVAAEPFVKVIFTDKWLPAVKFIQILCLYGFIQPLSAINVDVIIAKGKANVVLMLEVIHKVLFVAAMVVGFNWGIEGFLYANLIGHYITYFFVLYLSSRTLNYSIFPLLKNILPSFSLALVMSAVIYGIDKFYNRDNLEQLTVEIIVGILFYLGAAKVLHIRAFKDLIVLIREDILKRSVK
jgi:O-antigen/teichoic acid export membrane protein